MEYMTIGAAAVQLGMPRWQLAYLIERGDVPGPSVTVPGRRLFTAADIVRLAAALEARRARIGTEQDDPLGDASGTSRQRGQQ